MRTDAESCCRCHGWSLASLSDSEIPDDDVFCNLGDDGDAVRQQVLADVGQIKQQLMCLHEVLRVPTGSFGDALNSSSPSERVQRLFLCRRVSIFKDLRGKVSCHRIKCAQLERNREELVRYLEQSEDNIAHLKAELSKRDVELQHQQRCRSLGRPGTGWPHRPAGSAADKEDAIEQSELQKRVEGGSTGCHQVGVALGEGRRKRSDIGQKFPFSTFRGVSCLLVKKGPTLHQIPDKLLSKEDNSNFNYAWMTAVTVEPAPGSPE